MSRMTVNRVVGATLAFAALGWGTAQAQVGQSREYQASMADASVQAPAPWLQEDIGSQAYARARRYLNQAQYRDAAIAFAQLRADYSQSGYVADSYYYQAFALSRLGGRGELQEARALLRNQMESYPTASTLADARELMIRVESQLAQQGDARAAANITQQAQEACGPENELRAAALNALLNMNAERAVPLLRQVLEDRDACSAELRSQALFLLSQKLDDEAVEILLALAHGDPDPDPEVREQAVFWLSQVESQEAVDALVDILRESDDPEIQERALFALARHQSTESTEILKEYAERQDVSPHARELALFWLGQSPGGPEYLREVYGGLQEVELKERVLHSVAQARTEESQAWLVERAMDPSEDMEIRGMAVFWAGQSGAFSIGELRDLFNAFEDEELKERVLFVASQRQGADAATFLMEVAEDPENGELRERAIFWLGQSDDPRVSEFLLRIIGGGS